jgi:hypothetical protein
MNDYPPAENSIARLLRAGWNAGQLPPGVSPAGCWSVYIAKGEHFLDVPGQTRAEAWHRAAELARGLDRGDWVREVSGCPTAIPHPSAE